MEGFTSHGNYKILVNKIKPIGLKGKSNPDCILMLLVFFVADHILFGLSVVRRNFHPSAHEDYYYVRMFSLSSIALAAWIIFAYV